ncbi:MAG: hypothetical protein II977_04545 [Oscillospiraceae bacterium]|nr:hypothetical protein [Oscillospiraceae bacterium]
MTRFELAAILSRRLYMLTEEERHSIIDKYVSGINMEIEAGISEKEAVERLGDIDLLADRILMRHHIDPRQVKENRKTETDINLRQEEKENSNLKDTVNEAVHRATDAVKNAAVQSTETVKEVAAKTTEAVKTVSGKTADAAKAVTEKTADAAKAATEKTVDATKQAAGKTGRLFSRIGKSTAKITFSFVNFLLFLFVWIPSMLITALGVICTVAVISVYLFTGIGFMGVCLSGLGCCVVGISFCLWLGNILTGGKTDEQNI